MRRACPGRRAVAGAGRRDPRPTCREHLAGYKRIRRIEFAELPKTISGKIRRVELRADEADKVEQGESAPHAYDESDFH